MDLDNFKPDEHTLESKSEFIKQICNNNDDPETQALLMGELLKIMSVENKVEISEIMTNLSQEPGDINMGKLKEKLLSKK